MTTAPRNPSFHFWKGVGSSILLFGRRVDRRNEPINLSPSIDCDLESIRQDWLTICDDFSVIMPEWQAEMDSISDQRKCEELSVAR